MGLRHSRRKKRLTLAQTRLGKMLATMNLIDSLTTSTVRIIVGFEAFDP